MGHIGGTCPCKPSPVPGIKMILSVWTVLLERTPGSTYFAVRSDWLSQARTVCRKLKMMPLRPQTKFLSHFRDPECGLRITIPL